MSYLVYPNRANTGGFPLLEGTAAVNSTSGNLEISFQPHRAYGTNWTGGFWVKIANAITTGTQPVVFKSSGATDVYPLYSYSGVQVTAADIATTTGGVLLCFWDASAKKLSMTMM